MKTRNTKPYPSMGLVAALVLGVCATARAQEKPTLKETFEGDFLIGAAVNGNIARAAVGQEVGGRGGGRGRSPELITSDVEITKKHYNSISPENDLKWQLIHPNPGPDGYNFGPADAFVEFGEANDMYIVGHTLVWHSQTPNWVFQTTDPEAIAEFEANQPEEVAPPAEGRGRGRGGFGRGRGPSGPPATREELLERMRDHIHTVVGRYKGRIHSWDVVNEALSDGGEDYLRNSPWRNIIGDDFIAKAFEYAHEADPDAILRYNDYGLENPEKVDKLIKLVTQLKEQGVPIHAIGTQAHMNVSNANFDYMDASLTKIATLGLPIHVTELDINGAVGGQRGRGNADITQNAAQTQGGLVSEADERLTASYKGVFEAFMKHKDNLEVVTFWGVNDAVSWRANGAPLLFDGNNNTKPAYDAVIAVGNTIRIKAGVFQPFKDSRGMEWQVADSFQGGSTIDRDPSTEIDGTDQPELYLSETYGMSSFSLSVPNGKYIAKLHFAETFEGIFGPGERVFSYTVQGKEFKDFDIWAKTGGPYIAYVETVPIEVTDGQFRMTFTTQIENPEINAIELVPQY